MLADLRGSRDIIHAPIEAHPLHPVLSSIPPVRTRTEARVLTEIVGKEFATAGHLAASYAGLSPAAGVK
ncbi:transposase [Arthrobacter crystallopoietes BAB-32]|uniref:Transposase n=1 Tax=Arthrobacter crystallopoietes BAB-32 TaxID=1246476 RepID=N1VB45_9MICC|nr:transposase [Arthrobacter crystallopoietes BAB-32]